MQAIAFSLFGTASIYLAGMLRNAQLAREHYPGWKVICWCGPEVPKNVKETLVRLRVDVRGPDEAIGNQMFWRFLVADDPQVERYLVRDCDSRLGPRERGAVDAWIESGTAFHVMSDHPYHWPPVGGGLWSAKRGAVIGNMKDLVIKSGLAREPYTRSKSYNLDQIFLKRFILPMGRVLRHDSCCRSIYPFAKEFPGGRCFGDNRFVGEIFDENDKPHPWHWQVRVNHLQPLAP